MNNTNNNAPLLISQLEREINWVVQLNQLLLEEKNILAASLLDQLEGLASKKQELSQLLEQSASARMNLINHASGSPADSLDRYLQHCTTAQVTQINQLNNQLKDRLAECRELNTVNGQVIAYNIHNRQEIVNSLSGTKAAAVSVYTATGVMKSSSQNSEHHQKA
ncbi:MAG: flagella synthesis protein FlgN [Legionella sp.]